MFTCCICKFAVPLDEVEIRRGPAGCVCTGCYRRQTGTVLVMDKDWRRLWAAVVNEIP